MAGFYGADVAQLRSLAKDFQRASQAIESQGQNLTKLVNGTTAWTGQDSQKFRQDWNGSHRQTLLAAARLLEEGSRHLQNNADEQDKASGGSPSGTPGGTPGGSSGSSGNSSSPGNTLLDWGKAVLGLGLKVKDGFAVASDWKQYLSTKKILDFTSDLKGIKAFSWADDFTNFDNSTGLLSKTGKIGELIGKWGRFAGPVLAPLSIYGGISDMIDPEHEGWRGVGDRIAGGLGVAGGVGTLAMAAGLLTNPVGIGIVVGVGVVAAGWALGNMVADSEWGKAAGRWISNTATDAFNSAKSTVSNAWEGTKSAVSDSVEGAKKFFSNPVSSLGGLFG